MPVASSQHLCIFQPVLLMTRSIRLALPLILCLALVLFLQLRSNARCELDVSRSRLCDAHFPHWTVCVAHLAQNSSDSSVLQLPADVADG
ncbi:hypothetical protein DFH06DRAFT_1245219 [Mycena polygramma]|nr:hypothetical protein DFH06DRAFT_1245219 [Mycena polygramma]